MKKILNLIFIILIAILLKLLLTFTINGLIIINYNNNRYNTTLIKLLYPFNFNQPYIVFYNNGNLLYKKEKYTEAIDKYKKALDKNPPQNKVCDVLINLSLSMIKEIDNTYDYKTAYNQLEDAKNYLYQNNCASAIDNSGYSQEAENLEEEIKNLQNELNNTLNNEPPQEEEKEEENGEDYTTIEEQLKEIEEKSNAERQSELEKYENMGNYEYYSGKKW